jgi:hypothetical protein
VIRLKTPASFKRKQPSENTDSQNSSMKKLRLSYPTDAYATVNVKGPVGVSSERDIHHASIEDSAPMAAAEHAGRNRPRGLQIRGEETPQYEAVLQSMEDIIRSLQATSSAREALCTKFQMKRWVNITASSSEKDLVVCALERIRQDPSNYSTLLAMLREANLNTVVNGIEQKMRECGGGGSPSSGEP